ncbi:MAG: C4-dicarboxylate TRAP transporter substrate-binding protein [Acetobacteraceae bacterium]|nr:C4-dicarboxylate TRAP transporter substrate-binding protein [Acetobacteraceae bacterium]
MASVRRLVAAAVVIGLASAAASASARELIYVSNIPAKHPTHAIGLDPYFDAVTKATGGSLTFKTFPGGTLAGGKTALNAVQNGTADMALLADIYTPNDLPVSTLVSDLAVLGRDARVMTAAVNQMLLVDCPSCKRDYVRHKVLPLSSYSLTPYHFLCTKSGIAAPEDIVGRKIRGTGSMGQLVAALGGTPVNITSGEIYEGLQRGQLDCTLGPMPWLRSYTLWDLAKFVTDSSAGTYHGTNFINIRTETWKKLTPKERKAMADGLPHATRMIAEAYENDDDSVIAAGKEKGVVMVAATPALEAAIDKFRESDIKRVIETARGRGVKEPEKIVAQFRGNVEKWTRLVAEIGKGTWTPAQWDRYEALLRDEVFSKVKYP